jgi:ribosomal protein L40E
MPDLTDSFCERCGARHVVSPNAPRALSFKRARVLATGLKYFVLTDGQSMRDSLTLARHEDEHQDTNRATESFHRIFNFCMTCRQYACDRCWNSNASACLSCAPETGIEPVAPEDHLIVRTPVARWDADWSQFPDGPAVEPLARPAAPVPHGAPLPFAEAQPLRPPEQPDPLAWPAADLPAAATASTPGHDGKRHHASQPSADPEAWSLWPIADEIAPEMTLTPEELELVESRLGQVDAMPDPLRDRAAALEAPLPDGPAPSTPKATLAEDMARAPEGTPGSDAPMACSTLVSEPEPAAAEDSAGMTLSSAQQPAVPIPETQIQPQRILRKSRANQSQLLPLQTHPAPPTHLPETRERTPIFARLLGRRAPESATDPTADTQDSNAPAVEPVRDPWPHATLWSDRSPATRPRGAEGEALGRDAAPELVAPSIAPAPVPAPALAPAAAMEAAEPVAAPATQAIQAARPETVRLQAESAPIDARSAAAVRLSAVSASPAEPAGTTQPTVDLTVGWVEAPTDPTPATPAMGQPQVDLPSVAGRPQVAAASTPDRPTEPPVVRSTSPAPWPPLGASWPPQEDRGAVWPGPDAASVPAALAARQGATPTLDAMWALSAQEVLSRGSVRVCHRCALPVSTQARFCRRCGTQQA